MAVATKPPNHVELDSTALMLAAELANLSFNSTKALRGGSNPNKQRDADRQRRAGQWQNHQRPDPAAIIAQDQALNPHKRDILTSDGFKNVFASRHAPAPQPSGPFLPSLYQPNRKPINHFAKPGGHTPSPPRVRRSKKNASQHSAPPPSSSRRNQPPPPPVSGGRPPPRNVGTRGPERRPLVQTTTERTPVKRDPTPFGSLGKSRYASRHERVLTDLGKGFAKSITDIKPPIAAAKPPPAVVKPALAVAKSASGGLALSKYATLVAEVKPSVIAANPLPAVVKPAPAAAKLAAGGLGLSKYATPTSAIVKEKEELTITWTDAVESDGTITKLT